MTTQNNQNCCAPCCVRPCCYCRRQEEKDAARSMVDCIQSCMQADDETAIKLADALLEKGTYTRYTDGCKTEADKARARILHCLLDPLGR